MSEPLLGLASTDELIQEIESRVRVGRGIHVPTPGDDPAMALAANTRDPALAAVRILRRTLTPLELAYRTVDS